MIKLQSFCLVFACLSILVQQTKCSAVQDDQYDDSLLSCMKFADRFANTCNNFTLATNMTYFNTATL